MTDTPTTTANNGRQPAARFVQWLLPHQPQAPPPQNVQQQEDHPQQQEQQQEDPPQRQPSPTKSEDINNYDRDEEEQLQEPEVEDEEGTTTSTVVEEQKNLPEQEQQQECLPRLPLQERRGRQRSRRLHPSTILRRISRMRQQNHQPRTTTTNPESSSSWKKMGIGVLLGCVLLVVLTFVIATKRTSLWQVRHSTIPTPALVVVKEMVRNILLAPSPTEDMTTSMMTMLSSRFQAAVAVMLTQSLNAMTTRNTKKTTEKENEKSSTKAMTKQELPASRWRKDPNDVLDPNDPSMLCPVEHCPVFVLDCLLNYDCNLALQCHKECQQRVELQVGCNLVCSFQYGYQNYAYKHLLQCMSDNHCLPVLPMNGICLAPPPNNTTLTKTNRMNLRKNSKGKILQAKIGRASCRER